MLLADVSGNSRNMCHEIYQLDHAKFLSVSGLVWKPALKNTKVKLDLLIDINMLLMVEKGLRGGVYRSFYRHGRSNNKSMKDYDKHKRSSYLQYQYVNNSYCWAMLQKLSENNFEWIKDTFYYDESFIKNDN